MRSNDEGLVAAVVKYVQDTERRLPFLGTLVVYRDIDVSQYLFDVLLGGVGVKEEKEVDAIASCCLYGREEDRRIVVLQSNALKMLDSLGSVVIGYCDSVEAGIACCLDPGSPVRTLPICQVAEIVRGVGMSVEVDAPPARAGPIP